jgi:hypothetical protein
MYSARQRVDGKFFGSGGTVPASQAICSSLLEECFDITQEIKAREDSKNVGSSLKPIYDRLNEIRAELESLVMTHRWSLRETDLWNYSLSLQEIDRMRVDGKFVDSDGNMPSGQYVGFILERMTFFTYDYGLRSYFTFFDAVMVSSTTCYLQVSRYPKS